MGILGLVHVGHWVGYVLPVALYIGPDVFMPIASALAAVAGVLLMFWQRVTSFVARLFGRRGRDTGVKPTQASSEHRAD